MRRKDLLPLLPPGAVLMASLVVARFLGSNVPANLLAAILAGSASVTLGYLFSEDWRRLIVAQGNRARLVLGGLLTNRAKPIPPINTNAQK